MPKMQLVTSSSSSPPTPSLGYDPTVSKCQKTHTHTNEMGNNRRASSNADDDDDDDDDDATAARRDTRIKRKKEKRTEPI